MDFERASRAGAHTLGGGGDVYSPAESTLEIESAAHSYVLGGLPGGSGAAPTTPEQRRRRALEADVRRLQIEEEELEASCGTSGATHQTTTE